MAEEINNEEIRIGVYVCHCGVNIGGVVDCPDVAEYAKTLPNVVYATDYKYMCSDPGQAMILKQNCCSSMFPSSSRTYFP